MKIVFIGTVQFSKEILQKLIALKADVVGVVTKQKSDFHADFADLSGLCRKHDIPFYCSVNVNDLETTEWIRSLKPDVIFCFGWSQLIKRGVLNIAPLGVVGYHPTLLPENRGRHPIVWALVLGLEKTGSTFFFMDEGADRGDILSQEEVVIEYSDNAAALYDKLIKTALQQVEKFLPLLQNNTFQRIKQDNSQANYWRKRDHEDGEIPFNKSSTTVYNLVRALTRPYVGAHVVYDGQDVKIWKVQEDHNHYTGEWGEVLKVDANGILVKCQKGAVLVIEHDFQVMPQVGDVLHGQSISYSRSS